MFSKRLHPWFVVSLLTVACGCSPAPDAAVEAVEAVGPPVADIQSCREWLARALPVIERAPMETRWRPVLEAVAGSCAAIPEPLREAAARTASVTAEARPAVLAAAVDVHEAAQCTMTATAAPALDVAARCPMPPPFDFAPELLRDLDAGTYLFGRSLAESLAALDLLEAGGRRLVDTLLLSAAIANEALRQRG